MRNVFLWIFAGFIGVTYMSASVSFAGTTVAVSVNSAGKTGNGISQESSISADGRYVAFSSNANDLVQGDTNGKLDVFVRDRQTGETKLISRDSAGKLGNNDSSMPAISADGRYVAFRSLADNLVPGDTNDKTDVFVHDRQTGETNIISKDSAGTLGNNDSTNPKISEDGRFVAFQSSASTLVPGDTNDKSDIFIHDRQTGKTTLISKDSNGKQGNNDSDAPSISADGRYVVFMSMADNMAQGDTNGNPDVFIHDRQTGETKLVSRDSGGKSGNNYSRDPAISPDGKYVAFRSAADNLVPGDTNGKADIFVHDVQTGSTTLISKDSKGKSVNGPNSLPALSGDGRYVAFESQASNLVSGDTNGHPNAFIHDRKTGKTSIVSIARDGASANSDGCILPAISFDGRYVAFESDSSNLVPGDTNGKTDVFVHDRL